MECVHAPTQDGTVLCKPMLAPTKVIRNEIQHFYIYVVNIWHIDDYLHRLLGNAATITKTFYERSSKWEKVATNTHTL